MLISDIFERIHPAFYGVFIGSLLTIVGVILTNISNTKRLHLQHRYEREMVNKERDITMRRNVYLDAMEAISAGLVTVSQFSNPEKSPEALMESYTDLSPKIGKVTIVGHNETINAFANFNLELTGAFLRLSAKREVLHELIRQSALLESQIVDLSHEIEGLVNPQEDNHNLNSSEDQLLSRVRDLNDQMATLTSRKEEIDNQLMVSQMQLVRTCTDEVSLLDQMLVPLISLVRKELELPFDEENYAEILNRGHQRQREYLDNFFENFSVDVSE